MEELNIIIEPELEFTLKKCGDIVPYGITPEEKAKLAGIEENANNYTHPETHPASILDVVDVVNGAVNKFFNERGEMVAVAHESLTDKNSEASFQHVDVTTESEKATPIDNDKLNLWDSIGLKNVTVKISNFIAKLKNTFAKLTGGNVFSGNQEINGNIGIGTPPTTTPLTIYGHVNTGFVKIVYSAIPDYYSLISTNSFDVYPSSQQFLFKVAGVTKMAIKGTTSFVGIGVDEPKSKLQVAGAIQIADDTASASANKDGAIRYRKDANNSYIEMCMQTGASTYAWVIIKQNTW